MSLFEEHFHVSTTGSGGRTSSMPQEPKTRIDPAWSPVVDIKNVQVNAESGKGRATTNALVVIHRLAYQEGEEIVMGRFLLPVRRGLYEVIAIAGDGGGDRGASGITVIQKERQDPSAAATGDMSSLSPSVTTNSETTTSIATSTVFHNSSTVSDVAIKRKSAVRTIDMDGPQYDDEFPNHCLSRVRRAINWLTYDSCMVVTEMPLPTAPPGTEVELFHLPCRIVPPPRFLYCPNPYNPESNKYRFCRATLGGTDGVEMMVVSAWYTERDIGRGVKALKAVAKHATQIIHTSQQLYHIRIDTQEINLQENTNVGIHRRWLIPGRRPIHQDAVIATVHCTDAQGSRKQNTVGFVREPSTGLVFLVYFADTLHMDHNSVVYEISGTLASIRVPRSMSKSVRRNMAWHAPPAPVVSS